jgi:hypothetical protein
MKSAFKSTSTSRFPTYIEDWNGNDTRKPRIEQHGTHIPWSNRAMKVSDSLSCSHRAFCITVTGHWVTPATPSCQLVPNWRRPCQWIAVPLWLAKLLWMVTPNSMSISQTEVITDTDLLYLPCLPRLLDQDTVLNLRQRFVLWTSGRYKPLTSMPLTKYPSGATISLVMVNSYWDCLNNMFDHIFFEFCLPVWGRRAERHCLFRSQY